MDPIAILAPTYPELSETFVRRDVEGLRAHGHEIRTAGLRAGDADLMGNDTVHVVYGAGWASRLLRSSLRHPLRALATLGRGLLDALAPGEALPLGMRLKVPLQALGGLALADWLRHEGIRHLHCHFAHAPTTVGMYAARQVGIPFSFVGHANDLFQRRSLLRKKLQRAAFVACISEWHATLYRELEPSSSGRLRTIRCGVEVPERRADTRGRVAADPLRLISVARLVEKKGIDTLLAAVGVLLVADRTSVALAVVGEGPRAEALRAQAVSEGIAEQVLWIGALPNEAVRERLAESHVFVLPCRISASGDRDGIPVVLMEAMACGLPVVAGDLPAIRELVRHEDTGLLVPGGDVNAVRDAIRRLRSDPALRDRLGAAGRMHVEREFSLAVNIERLERAIRETRRA